MQKKLFLTYLIIIVAALGISSFSFWRKGYSIADRKTEQQHLMEARLLGDLLEQEGEAEVEDYTVFVKEYSKKYGIRITLINADGSVAADSGKDGLDNHATRQEVAKALQGEESSVVRYSGTMKKNYAYSAVPARVNGQRGVLRISVPYEEIKVLRDGLGHSILVSLALCLFVAVVLAFIFMKTVSKPFKEAAAAAEEISEGNFDARIHTREKAELRRMADAFNNMADHLKETVFELTKRNMEMEAMLRSMKSGAAAVDEDNHILFHNDAFCSLVGQGRTNYRGESLYHVLRNALTFETVDEVRKTGEGVVREGGFIGGGDETKTLRVTATPLIDSGQSRMGVLLLMDDITHIKKLESIRSDFVSNVTHELKTPLTSIRGFIDTLKNGALEDKETAARFLDIIDIESERLYHLIQDILLLSEIEQRKEEETREIDVNECVSSVLELLEPHLKEGVSFRCRLNCAAPFRCNPDRMKQLLINLVDNAVKYTEKGTITVTCREEDKNLFLSVADTGIGIDKEDQERIFERFYRVDKSRSRKQGGTGLGLSIVKHIISLYNGTIQVRSIPGEGTSFEIRLPRC